ncbi:MAG: Hsp20 family protein [Alphaproteobacteria bacterium]
MRAYDLTPLFRSTVGFDRLNSLFEAAFGADESAFSYPPYNIEKVGEDRYRITMAVAGFGEDDLSVTAKDDHLVVVGKLADEPRKAAYLYRGIATRAFERKFSLADHVHVVGATLSNGLLHIDLVRELPESMKPRKVPIEAEPASTRKTIEGKKAA